jgi:hypothetical protein
MWWNIAKYFGWAGRKRYENELKWLENIREKAKEWYNDLLEPLGGLLYSFRINDDNKLIRDKYSKIAIQMHDKLLRFNAGNDLDSLIIQIGDRGIPYFTERNTLKKLMKKYLDTGDKLKKVFAMLEDYDTPQKMKKSREQVIAIFDDFKKSREDLIQHVDELIGRLG